nr:4-hydroxy-tetrahydrodipicolinate synthase [Escherichia coli]
MNQTMKFSGAVCPSVIPLDDSGQIDLTGLEKHMARLSDSGINGILLSGTIGEFATMSVRERAMLILEARKMSDLPLIAHISSTVEEDMLYLADAAYDSGYDAVMVLPQYYYAQTSRQLLREGANKQVISSQADSLIKISRIWADFFPANTSNQPI